MSIGVHHGSVLSSLLFIIMPEVFSRVLRSGAPLGYLCRSSCHHCWIDGGICQEAFDIEKAMGEMGLRVNAYDEQYRPGPPAEFREVPMRCLSSRGRQKQHLLHIILITAVHGAEEL